MPEHYSQRRLTEREWREIEAILLDQMEMQGWYGVTFLPTLGEEILLTTQ
ncbi:MAG: hypothetical protein HYW57_10250 [Ignavibacteriales bacterium]|nr:hypothetical protein [Ignavibacteriales bacterium]